MIISRRNDKQREILMRFFRTSPGEYGEGDEFLGLKVPETRAIVKQARLSVPFDDISRLLDSKWHEIRLAALLLLVEEMNAALPHKRDNDEAVKAKSQRREDIARFYLDHARRANNWDLVDLSCEFVLGPYIYLSGNYEILSALAMSDNLWEQRIAVVTTFYFIRKGLWKPTFDICDMLLGHKHDLIHKAMGWMMREVGKRDRDALIGYLESRLKRLPRTTLRYAIERFPAIERNSWLKR